MAVRHPKNLDQDVSLCLPAPDRMNWPTVSTSRPDTTATPGRVRGDEGTKVCREERDELDAPFAEGFVTDLLGCADAAILERPES